MYNFKQDYQKKIVVFTVNSLKTSWSLDFFSVKNLDLDVLNFQMKLCLNVTLSKQVRAICYNITW